MIVVVTGILEPGRRCKRARPTAAIGRKRKVGRSDFDRIVRTTSGTPPASAPSFGIPPLNFVTKPRLSRLEIIQIWVFDLRYPENAGHNRTMRGPGERT